MHITSSVLAFTLVATTAVPATAQSPAPAVVLAPPPVSRAPKPGLEVIVEPEAGFRPSFCPSSTFNGAHIVCAKPGSDGTARLADALRDGGPYDVTLQRGAELIWKGTLFLAGAGSSASISQNRTDSFPCQPVASWHSVSQQLTTSFSIRVSAYQPSPRVRVSVEVTRPFDNSYATPAPCADRSLGTKTVRFETQIDLAGKIPVTLLGDAGLSFTIARAK